MRYLFNATYSTWFQPQKDCMHKICRQQRCVQHHPVPDSYVCPACFYFYELYVNKIGTRYIIEKCKGHSRTKSIWNVILPQNLVLFLAHLSRRPWFALGMWPEMAPPWAGSAASNNSSSSDTKVVPDHSKRVTPDVNHLRVCSTVHQLSGKSTMPSWPCCPMWASLSSETYHHHNWLGLSSLFLYCLRFCITMDRSRTWDQVLPINYSINVSSMCTY